MKIFFIILSVIFSYVTVQAQSPVIALYRDSLDKADEDTAKARFLYILGFYYQYYKPDSALLLAQASYNLSMRSKFVKGQAASLGVMGGAFNRMGNFSKALEYYIEQLKILEKQPDQENIATAYLSIALVYNSQKDAKKALYYAYKADSIARANKLTDLVLYTSLDIGDIYYNNNQPDSALVYTRLCYIESVNQKNYLMKGTVLSNLVNIYFESGIMQALQSLKNSSPYLETIQHKYDLITGTALNNMGNIYFKLGKYIPALNSFKNSIPYVEAMHDYNTLAECNLGMAKAFDKLHMPDSAFYYGNRSFQMASNNQFLRHALNASGFLGQLYKQQKRIDSAFTYQETYITLKDSFDNSEKVKQLQSLTITEQLRQQQIAEQRSKERKDRRLKMELLLIGMFIPVLFFISVYLGRRKVHRRVIQFSIIFSLLFLFEYIIFLLIPLVAKGTNHTPVLEILVFVAIAAIISPTHHRIEHWLMTRLTERHNNKLQATVKAAKEDEIRLTDE